MEGLGKKVASGAIWITTERVVVQMMGFAVSMVLARMLTPGDYGTIALLTIFFAIAESMASCGFGNALVQKKEATELDFNSVFYASMAISLMVYGAFFLAAPAIARFYDMPELRMVTRVAALQFIFSAVNSVQCAELSRKMLFRKRFRISMITCVASATCGIVLAYAGWGVWALVISSLVGSAASVVAWWTIIAWRPKLQFSFAALYGLFSYGWKLSLAGVIHTTYMNMYGFLIGKMYSPVDLALVNRGKNLPDALMSTIDTTILGVSFPALAKMQDDKPRLREAMRRMIQSSTFLVFPLLTGLAICAQDVILLLFGGQWAEAVPYVQVACISFALYPFNSINTSAISAMGRSDIFLWLDVIKKGVGVVVMLIAIRHGVLTFMLVMAVIMSPFSVAVNTFANGRLLGYSLKMQLMDVMPSAVICAIMGVVVAGVQWVMGNVGWQICGTWQGRVVSLVVSAVVGAAVYFGLAHLFGLRAYREYVETALPMLKVVRGSRKMV